MKSFAYLGSSKEGGTYRVFETLRDGLATWGWEGHFVNEQSLPEGIVEKDEGAVLEALRDHLGKFDAVIGNVFISVRLMNVLRFLPAETPRIMVVHSITRATYLAARALKDHVHHTVAVSPRIRNDLIGRFGFNEHDVTTIFSAVSDELFQLPESNANTQIVRLLALGRIEERSKRVFFIPEMLSDLDPNRYRLTVAGNGPDLDELLSRLRASSIPFDAVGRVERGDLPEIYRAHEIFLFPSRFEGMGIALAEAMASGLVPLAARIQGVTNVIVEDGVSGHIFDQSDLSAARVAIQKLIDDASNRLSMRIAAHERAGELFYMNEMATEYATVLNKACVAGPMPPEDLRHWRPPLAMGRGLRGLLPSALRRRLGDLLAYR